MKHLVQIIESERGWGQKLDEEKLFDTKELAEDYISTHNSKNNLPQVPDIYWRAEYGGLVKDDYKCKK